MRHTTRIVAAAAAVLLGVLMGAAPASADEPDTRTSTPIRHFIFLMQGDRTFDNYFGTYPGADGIPAGACQALVLNHPENGCVRPFALHGKTPDPLAPGADVIDKQLDGGKLDGFVAAFTAQGRDGSSAMGYYDRRDLTYYWNLAEQYVLFDAFFSAVPYGYRANRDYWVSAAAPPGGDTVAPTGYGDGPTIFDRLEAAGVSWKFYVQDYQPAQTFRTRTATDPAPQTVRVPLLNYARFVDDPRLRGHIVDLDQYYRDLADGSLPAVAYVASSGSSERSARSIPAGQTLVHSMVNQLMLSRFWSSSAFMWSYDGSGGWYDHVVPPAGLGLRVPAVLVSPYARRGQVNHTRLDYTSALAFVEHNWGVAPLTGRDASAIDLTSAFDFAAKPRPAEIVSMNDQPAHAPLVRVGLIYGWYGGAAVLALVLVAVATGSSRRRPKPVARPRPPTREEVPVP